MRERKNIQGKQNSPWGTGWREEKAGIRKMPGTEDNAGAGGKTEAGGAEGMEGRGATGSLETCGETRVTFDLGRDRWTREPGGAGGMTGHGGAEEALSQSGADGLEDRGEVQGSVARGGDR